jgi:hypothetical protein
MSDDQMAAILNDEDDPDDAESREGSEEDRGQRRVGKRRHAPPLSVADAIGTCLDEDPYLVLFAKGGPRFEDVAEPVPEVDDLKMIVYKRLLLFVMSRLRDDITQIQIRALGLLSKAVQLRKTIGDLLQASKTNTKN